MVVAGNTGQAAPNTRYPVHRMADIPNVMHEYEYGPDNMSRDLRRYMWSTYTIDLNLEQLVKRRPQAFGYIFHFCKTGVKELRRGRRSNHGFTGDAH